MARRLDKHVAGSLAHRTGYGQAGPSTVEFRYQATEEVAFTRPDDGQPAATVKQRCSACDKRLSYRVYSVRTTRLRRALWRVLALAVWAQLAAAVAYMIVHSGDDSAGSSELELWWPVCSILGGLVAGIVSVQLARGEFGVRGHLTGWPIMAKHSFVLAPAEEDLPTLACERCDYREPLEPQGYQAAKARLRQHTCV